MAKRVKKRPARGSKKKAENARKPTRKKASPQKKKASTRKKKTAAPSDAWRHVNRLQLAELAGVHLDTISRWTRQGMPVLERRGGGKGESTYDAVACLEWWREHNGKNAKEAAQTRAYEAQAKLNELKLQVQKGELIPREDVITTGQSYTKAWTAKIRALPRQMVQTGLLPREKEGLATAMLHQVLTEISQWKELPG